VGLLDRLLGRDDQSRGRPAWNPQAQQQPRPREERSDDEVAIERYRYMLRTAPPDQVEQAHAEAFEKLTPQQRQQVLADLSAEVPPGERAQSDDPRSLARMATRAEMRQPGTMERALGGGRGGGGIGMGGLIAGGLLASVAGAFVGTAIADAMFDSNDSGESTDASADGGDAGGDAGGDSGGDAGGDAGGDYGGSYGDGGGFDGGGGDFGGGDFGGF
jgi:hypothetical protein